MLSLEQQQSIESLVPEVENHPAWIGNVSALKIEKILRSFSIPYLYALRAGENKGDYYVTYIDPNAQPNKIVHRPFTITLSCEGWYYENYGNGGPYVNCTINEVIFKIMHCDSHECIPYIHD